MASNAEALLCELLIGLVDTVAELDRNTAQISCEIIKSQMYNDDGSTKSTTIKLGDSNEEICEVQLPTIALFPPNLLYVNEISFELTGSDALRIVGESLRTSETKDLSEAGQRLRKQMANYGFNSDIKISRKGTKTSLTFTIIKDSTTMTRFMEDWLNDPTNQIVIKNIDKIEQLNKQ